MNAFQGNSYFLSFRSGWKWLDPAGDLQQTSTQAQGAAFRGPEQPGAAAGSPEQQHPSTHLLLPSHREDRAWAQI